MMIKKYIFLLLIFDLTTKGAFAQYDVPLYTSYTTIAARTKLYDRLTKYSIQHNLSQPLNDSTEQDWEAAFSAIEVLLHKSPFTNQKIHQAFEHIEQRSVDFQRALLELAYSNYPGIFFPQVINLMNDTNDPTIFALCAEYLVELKKDKALVDVITRLVNTKFGDQGIIDPVLYMLQVHLAEQETKGLFLPIKSFREIFSKRFLPGRTVMYSIQRRDRDYPGLLVVRDQDGNFLKDSNGVIFNIPQLARSITNVPFYLHAGNTPQGIYWMHGFGVSMSSFIGPTANVQLSMPAESSIKDFLGDNSISDTTWNIDYYKRLIPADLENYLPLFYSYYAGLAGRREIIAHGTTIDPKLYSTKPYFPLTPSEGCLCTKEIWNGNRVESDQQKLVNALLKAGGANGYCVVIELDDQRSAVTLKDVLPLLNDR